jgi:ubiquinone/menaquinone biosynthesis C-methylase UbiE
MYQPKERNPAETYQEFFGPAIFIPWAAVLLEHARPKARERVLDLACGTGIVAREVAAIVGRGGAVTGLDVSPDMLEVAEAFPEPEGPTIEYIEAPADQIPLADGSVDLVLCQQGLQFFPDRRAAAREMRRVLAPGGRAAVSVWQGLERQPVMRALFEAEARHLNMPVADLARPFSLGDEGELREIFEQAGFERVEVSQETRDVHFGDPERFVELTVRAGAAVMKELDQKDPEVHERLVEAVRRETSEILERHRHGEVLSFPMPAHIAVAWR